MATIEKYRSEIEKAKAKIGELQKKVRDLEQKIAEEENLEIVRMVKAVKMDRGELSAFLKAYASGEITLPEGDYSGDTEEMCCSPVVVLSELVMNLS